MKASSRLIQLAARGTAIEAFTSDRLGWSSSSSRENPHIDRGEAPGSAPSISKTPAFRLAFDHINLRLPASLCNRLYYIASAGTPVDREPAAASQFRPGKPDGGI